MHLFLTLRNGPVYRISHYRYFEHDHWQIASRIIADLLYDGGHPHDVPTGGNPPNSIIPKYVNKRLYDYPGLGRIASWSGLGDVVVIVTKYRITNLPGIA